MLTQCLLYFNHVCTKLSVPCRCDNISVVQWSGRNCVYITSLCQGLTANAMNLKTVYNVNIFIKLVAQCLRTLEVRVWHPGSVLISPCTTSLSCHQPLRSGLSELHLINLMTYISLSPHSLRSTSSHFLLPVCPGDSQELHTLISGDQQINNEMIQDTGSKWNFLSGVHDTKLGAIMFFL